METDLLTLIEGMKLRYIGVTCSGSSCSSAVAHTPCQCDCGGSRHGLRRIEWATAYDALGEPRESSQTVIDLVEEWRTARTKSTEKLQELIEKQQDRRRKVSPQTLERTPLTGLQNTQAHASAEYVRTVSLVLWMAQNRTERERIDALAQKISVLGTRALDWLDDQNNDRARYKKRLGDHLWCDGIAAIVAALQEIQDLRHKLATNLSESISELTMNVVRKVRESRSTSNGSGPTSRKKTATRAALDHTAGLSEVFLEKLVEELVKCVVLEVIKWDPQLEPTLLKLRILALLFCPDPSAHKLVWENCWCPVFRKILEEESAEELEQLNQFIRGGLDQPHTWGDRRIAPSDAGP